MAKRDHQTTAEETTSETHFSRELFIVTQFFPPDFAATGQLIEELSYHLGNLGLKITVFTGQPGYAFKHDSAPAQEQQGSVRVRRSRVSRLWSHRIRGKAINSVLFCLRAAIYLLGKAHKRHILLLTTAPPYLNILGYVINRLTGIPYVCLIYDLYPDVAVELHVVSQDHVLARLWHWINRKIWRQAHHVIVLSPTMKQRILKHCPEIGDRISVIHNWAEPTWISPMDKGENWFAQHYNLHEKFTILYSGNLGRCHDVDTILEAAGALQNSPVQFVFIGGGAQQPYCLQKIQEKGLKNCLFLPYQERATLPYSLTACDLSLVSIKAGMEGLVAPSKVYSALAAGRPIAAICDSTSYLTDLLAAAHCGQTFRQGDSDGLVAFIHTLLAEPERGIAMGTAGRRYMERHFAPDVIARQYMEVLCFGGQVNLPLIPEDARNERDILRRLREESRMDSSG